MPKPFTAGDFATDILSEIENDSDDQKPPSVTDFAASILNGPSAARIPGMEKLGPLPSAGARPSVDMQPETFGTALPQPKAAGIPQNFGENVVQTAKTLGTAATTPFEQGLSQGLGTPTPPTMGQLYQSAAPSLLDHAKSAIDTVFGSGTADKLPQDFPWLPFVGHLANESAKAGMSLLDFGRTPVGMALPGTVEGLPASGQAGVGAGFAASMAPETAESIRQASANPNQQNVARAVVQSALNLLPAAGAIPSLMALRRAGQPETSPPPLAPPEAETSLAPLAGPGEVMNQAARRATAMPPEQGVPDVVSRAVDARNRLALQLAGKPFSELNNPERIAIDDLVAHGYVGQPETPQGELPLEPTTPSAPLRPTRKAAAPSPEPPRQAPQATPTVSQIAQQVLTEPEPGPAAPVPPTAESATIPSEEPNAASATRRPTNTSQPLPEPRPPSNSSWNGESTTVRVAGTPVAFEARYAVRDLGDVYASHNSSNFQPNPEYQFRNDRDYSQPEAAARVINASRPDTFDPAYLINTNPDAVNGPPIINSNGNVLGGNSRTMILSRVYSGSPEAAANYKNALVREAANFGFDPNDIAAMRQPILVRELTRELSPDETQRAITQFNQPPTAALRPAERALADSRGLTPQTLDFLSSKIDEQGPDGTLAQALEGRGGPDIVNRLVSDGVITTQERPQFIDDRGMLTADGKQRISKLLIGRLFETPDQFEATPPALRNKLERIVAPLARLQGRPDWDLSSQVGQALDALAEARAHGITNLQDLVSQQDMFAGSQRIAPDVLSLAQRLKDDGPRKLAQAFSQYAQDERLSRPGEPATFVEPPTRQSAFDDAFGTEPQKSQSIGDIATDLLRSEEGSSPLDPLGVGQFSREEVMPALRRATAAAVEAVDQARSLVAPQTRGEAAGNVALSLRHGAATMVRAYDREVSALQPFKQLFRVGIRDQQTSIARNHDFISRMEDGSPQATPQLDAAAQVMRQGLDARRDAVQALGTGKLEAFLENYFPHFWEKPPEPLGATLGRIGGKRPLQGPASFLKKRVFETFQDGLDAGYKPLSDDPIDFYLWKSREMDRYLMAHQFLQEQKGLGLSKFVKAGKSGPDGWEPLPDPIGNVFYRTDKGELVTAGKYWMPSDPTQVVSNFLSPGLRGNPLFRAWLGTGNLLLRARLGLSAFHGGFSALTASVSEFAAGLEKALRGDFTGAGTSIARTPIAFLDDLRNGGRYMQEWSQPGTTDARTAQLANAYEAGGGRAKMDQFYATKIADRMVDAIRRGNIIGGMLRLPGAAIEVASRPVMEWMVPRLKFAAFSKLADMELERLGPDAPKQAIERAMASIVDSIEGRYGQLTYDNLFFNKAVKDLGMSSVQSLGWNLGTFRLAIGGTKELGQAVVNREINPEKIHDLAFLVSLPLVHAAAGSIINYLSTGQPPQDVKDAFFPRTGGLDEKGRPERWFLPSYIKDAVHMYQSPLKALANKAHPIINTTYDMLTNKDYWGTEIRHEDDPLVQQGLETLKFLGKQVEPYSFQGSQKQYERGARGPSLALPFFGLSPAPSYINKSAAETLADQFASSHMDQAPRTQAQFDRSRAMSEVVNPLRQKQDITSTVRDLLAKGTLAPADLPEIRRRAMTTQLAAQVSRLTLDQALKVYDQATPAERQEIRVAVRRKAISALNRPAMWTPATTELSEKYLKISPRPRALPGGLQPLSGPQEAR